MTSQEPFDCYTVNVDIKAPFTTLYIVVSCYLFIGYFFLFTISFSFPSWRLILSFIDRAMTTDMLIGHGYTNLLIVCNCSSYIFQAINSTLFIYIVNNSHINVMDS